MGNTPDIDTIVVGGGLIGLAIAARSARRGHEVVVLERQPRVGQEISARSSEVVHAGIYYPSRSLKAAMCVEGRAQLYSFSAEHGVSFRKTGKLIVATSSAELASLRALEERALANGVSDIRLLSGAEARALEPELACVAALLSPSTGIIDSHGLIHAVESQLRASGGRVVANTHVTRAERRGDGTFRIEANSGGHVSPVTARNLFVAAGLGAIDLSPHLPKAGSYAPPRFYLAKGHYFTLRTKAPFHHLVYPMPDDAGLGIHLTLDLQGRARFGPDVAWIDRVEYGFDDPSGTRKQTFETSIRRYWPALPVDALEQGYTGIRPKLSDAHEPARDFAIHGPAHHGIDGMVSLYGIESPGLTSCLTIADYAVSLIQ